MRVALPVMVGVMVGGCAIGDTTPLPGQDQAVDIIWHQIYGEQRDAPPIYWRRDRCNVPNGDYPPLPNCHFDDLSGNDVAGLQRDTPWHVEIGAPWGSGKISDTALAHELLHASIGDAEHKSDKWLACPGAVSPEARAKLCAVLGGCVDPPSPPTKSLLCQANETLIAAGL